MSSIDGSRDYDVIVLGGGAPGELCAGALAEGGLRVAVVERGLVGGECSYWACIPSKTLLRPGEAVQGARGAVQPRRSPMGEAGMEKISFRKLAPGWQAVARVITVVALAASCLTAAGAPAHAANLEQHNPVTYNMQGASADTTPKWSSDIPSLLNHDVIALQEAGPLPPLDPGGVFSYQDTHTSPSGPRVELSARLLHGVKAHEEQRCEKWR